MRMTWKGAAKGPWRGTQHTLQRLGEGKRRNMALVPARGPPTNRRRKPACHGLELSAIAAPRNGQAWLPAIWLETEEPRIPVTLADAAQPRNLA